MTAAHRFRMLAAPAIAALIAAAASGPGRAGSEEGSSSATSQDTVRYVAPSADFPARRIGAGIRGMGRFSTIQILAPDHLGYTIADQPTLYWYLAEPTTTRIEFTLRDETSIAPLVEAALPAPAQPGIQALPLADFGVKLAPGTRYLWFVSLVADAERRSKDFTSGAWITRRAADDALRARLAAAGESKASVYAASGLWYDAIDALSSRIAASPAEAELRAQRAALLEQAGLSEVADYARFAR